jgi:hypothetical protein
MIDLDEQIITTGDPELAKKLEIEGIHAAEKEEFDAATALFTQSIQACPTRASGYNNRAQTYRLLGKIEGNVTLCEL